jgi:membrane protease YdiL (CAAX protease family)
MSKPDAPSKSILYLFAATVAWQIFAFLPALLLNFRIEYAQSHAVPFEGRGFFIEIAKLVGYIIVLSGDYVLGRVIGQGNIRTGLGYHPISARPMVTLMAILIATYAILWDVIHYFYYRDLVYRQFVIDESSPWLSLIHGFFSVLLAPVSEELFYRGWLWTGLRKRWGALSTGMLTGMVWVGVHSPQIWVWFLPAAVMLSVARHLGQSVRASIALHIIYNFIVLISPRVLSAAGLL